MSVSAIPTTSATSDVESTDRKSTRLNSSHSQISYAVFCLKKKSAHGHPPRAPSPPVLRNPRPDDGRCPSGGHGGPLARPARPSRRPSLRSRRPSLFQPHHE